MQTNSWCQKIALWLPGERQMGEAGGQHHKSAQGNFGDEEYVYSPDRGHHFYRCMAYIKTYQIVPLNMCNLLHVNYSSIKLL